ncbi:MAG: homocysteine S-methyltransferase family protein, partial [Gaiellaceae bacterium]
MKDTREQLTQLLAERILVLDGSWGVLIHRRELSEEEYRGERFAAHSHDVKGDPDLLNLTAPHVVSEIHDAYFEAGADIATTNTFTATSIGQADYALEGFAAEMSLEGARLARAAADDWTARTPDRPRFVAGSVGPLNVTLSLSPKVEDPAYRAVTFDAVQAAYEEQIAA